ncbi:MAG: Di-and tricarboxylate transporter [Clostridiales bacterium]|nr:MAG: Di-and tricarboxylate transporter [Clostridiales bacterium]
MVKKGKKNFWLHIIVGPTLLLLCIYLLPASAFESFEARAAIGTVAWMAYWWITGPVDYAVTALLPIAVNALLSITDMSGVISNYASETILLLLGASVLTVSWEITGLDKRIAAVFLGLIGTSLTSHIIFWFLLSTVLSAVLPNAVVCATITPIAVSMLKYVGISEISGNRTGSLILMTIAWGAGVGGLASPLGGAMNLVVVDYIQELTGTEYMYSDWVIKFLPIMLLLIVSNIIFLLCVKPKKVQLSGSRDYFRQMRADMGKMSRNEIICLSLFLIATVLSFSRSLYSSVLPGLKPAYVFIICAILSFLVRNKEGERIMKWNYVQTKIVWSLIYVFAGGLAAGTLLTDSGADLCIGELVSGMGLTGGFVTVLVIVAVTILLSDVTSNTATAAVAIPIVISIINVIGLNPIPYVFIATIGVNLSYMLPTSIRAIPVGYGMSPSFMFKKGVVLTVILIALLSVSAWALLSTGWFNLA